MTCAGWGGDPTPQSRDRKGLTLDSQEVVARLSVRPMSHSHLTDSICRRWHEHDDFEPVLLEVKPKILHPKPSSLPV